ncbi:hypothetical protein [Actinoplanes subtropicus]|uniref:hypothetical protein n=1 Tax=Actinoplanes subtropicus TaxID=543632 RepID=UPI0012F91BA8|nr:hypothetical protein [Actinoplanes subtropicus]
MEESAEPVVSADVELCQRGGFSDRVGQGPQWSGVADAPVWPVFIVVMFVLAQVGVQQGGQPGPVSRGEPHPIAAQLPLQNHDLMPQREDLGFFVAVTHRQQP